MNVWHVREHLKPQPTREWKKPGWSGVKKAVTFRCQSVAQNSGTIERYPMSALL